MYAIAMKYLTIEGDTKIKAFHVDAESRDAALGVAFGKLVAFDSHLNMLLEWDVAANHETIMDVIRPYVAKNQKISAIKALRTVEFMGLREAKEYVERYWNEV